MQHLSEHQILRQSLDFEAEATFFSVDHGKHRLQQLPVAQEYYPTWRRRELLLRGFNFHCNCTRCCGDAPEMCCAFICPECEVGGRGVFSQ